MREREKIKRHRVDMKPIKGEGGGKREREKKNEIERKERLRERVREGEGRRGTVSKISPLKF